MKNFQGPTLLSGSASVMGHCGEILQGQFSVGGAISNGLVTMPIAELGASAIFRFERGAPSITVYPREFKKAQAAAKMALANLCIQGGGSLYVTCELPNGGGCGSSSACVHASISAVSNAFSRTISLSDASRIALEAEGAVDPIHLAPRALLFGQTEGCVLEDFAGNIPPMKGIAVFDGEPLDTLSFERPVYSSIEMENFSVLRAAVRNAVAKQDVSLLGRVATASGLINQKYLHKQQLDDVVELADRNGAAGVCVSHSGPAMAVLVDPAYPDHKLKATVTELKKLGFKENFVFSTPTS